MSPQVLQPVVMGKENLVLGEDQVSMALPVREQLGMMECWKNGFKGIDATPYNQQ